MEHAILNAEDGEKYSGCYVAITSLVKGKVLAGGKNPVQVMEEAGKKGYGDPILFFVPKKDKVYIY